MEEILLKERESKDLLGRSLAASCHCAYRIDRITTWWWWWLASLKQSVLLGKKKSFRLDGYGCCALVIFCIYEWVILCMRSTPGGVMPGDPLKRKRK